MRWEATRHKRRTTTTKMLIETINAIATTVIAFLVAVITWRQLSTDRSRLRHELFDRRYKIYEGTF